MLVKRDLEQFLMENGFTVRSIRDYTAFTYGHSWTHTEITGEIYPLQINKRKGKWYCYLLGLALPSVPEPHELVIVLEQLKTFGVK